jgi:hypothetical protein
MSNVYPWTLAEEIEQWVREDQKGRFELHPEPDKLAAYHAGSLSPNEDLEIQQHLLLCPECPDLLLDLEDLFEPRHRDLDLSDTWISGAWRDLRAKLGNAQDSESLFWRRWMYWFSAVPRPANALATGLMFFLWIGGTVQISALRQELARPDGQVAVVAVGPGSSTRSANPAPVVPKQVEFRPGVNKVRLDLRLVLLEERDFQRIEAEIWQGERMRWQIPSVSRTQNLAPIEISRRSLKPGEYEVRIKGFHSNGKETEDVYPIEIIHL